MQQAEWPSNAEHLDALDRELALINCTKVWIDGATAGITPRTALIKNRDLLNKRMQRKKSISGSSSSSNKDRDDAKGPTIFVYSLQQMKKLKPVDKSRHEFIQQSCRNFALQVVGLKKSLRKDLEALTQSVVEERPLPFPSVPIRDDFIMSNMSSSSCSGVGDYALNNYDYDYDGEGEEEGEGRRKKEEVEEEEEEDMIQLPDGWSTSLEITSPREEPFGRSREASQTLTSILLPPSLKIEGGRVSVSKQAPFGVRASGLLLRPSIISMNPSHRIMHVKKVLPGIVDSISDEIVHHAIEDCKNKKRLRPVPMLSSRAATTFSKCFDAVVTKQREAISNLARSQVQDIMQKLKKELNTVKNVQSSLGATWMMLIAIVIRHQQLGHAVARARAKSKLHRAANKIQAAIRAQKTREMKKKIDVVRPILAGNIWWFVLKMKTKMRRRHSKLLRLFVRDYVGGVGVKSLVYKFRWKIICTQKVVRSFLACKHAKMIAIQLAWDREEKNIRTQKILVALRRAATAQAGAPTSEVVVEDEIDSSSSSGPEDMTTTMTTTTPSSDPATGTNDLVPESVVPRETFQQLNRSFHRGFLKTNAVLLRASLARLGNSEALKEIEEMGKWSKWRGGFNRVCSREVMRVLLDPWLFKKRRLYINSKNAQREKVSEGCQSDDMMAFMKGESWEELAERLKPQPVPWKLFTELRQGTELLELIKEGLLRQIEIDAAVEIQKLQLL